MKIKQGDKVIVISGKDKNRPGVVERAYPKSGRVIVKGLNVYKKHTKKSETNPKGGIIEISRPLAVNKLMLLCPSCKERTRVGILLNAKGKKQRVCKKCQKVIGK